MENFYLNLPSEKASPFFSPANYTITLDRPIEIDFSDWWECAITEVHLPPPLEKRKARIVKYGDVKEEGDTEDHIYITIHQLYKSTAGALRHVANQLRRSSAANKLLSLSIGRAELLAKARLKVDAHLSYLLGLSTQYLEKDKVYKINMKRVSQVPNFYLYTNIIRYQYVGDAVAPLLRIVQSNKSFQQFTQPYYLPINRDILQTINIRVCDAEGKEIEFDKEDRVVCVLHFRRKQ